MNLLDDSMNITKLAIPGSHDSCTFEFENKGFLNPIYYFFGQTQSWNLYDQLISGIRYLDIRVSGDGNIYHGIAKTKSTFSGVFEIITNFLNKYQSEGLIMRVKFERRKCNGLYSQCLRDKVIKIFNKYDDFIYDSGIVPNVGDLRGKIYLITDNFRYKDYLIWDEENFALQDFYDLNGMKKIEIKKKKDLVYEYLYKKTDQLIINHCSGVGQAAMTDIKYVSYKVNEIPYINKNYTGILPIDFPGEELISYIIDINLKLNITE